MDERDLRQLKKMRQQINSYRDGYIGLQPLVGDLIFLRDALSEVEQDWECEFTERIVDLESANAYALEKNAGKLDSVTQKVIDDALPKLLNLIEQKEVNVV